MANKNVMISHGLFVKLVLFFDSDLDDEYTTPEAAEDIRRELRKKLDHLVSREYFTAYKTAGTSDERELYRFEYLTNKRKIMEQE